MEIIDRLAEAASSDDKLKKFPVAFNRVLGSKTTGTVNVQCRFEFDNVEVLKLTDHGLKRNIEHKIKLAMRSILIQVSKDLEGLA